MNDSNPSEPMTQPSNKQNLTAEDILSFLRDTPKFLAQNPEAIDLLNIPGIAPGKGVADFQTYMIDRLKADKEDIEQATMEIVENARSNMNNQQRIQGAVLRLLEANSFDDFVHSLTIDLSQRLGTDIGSLIVETDGQSIPHISNAGIRIVPEGTVANWMQGQSAILQDNISGIEPIYGGGATLVQSQILLRIDISLGTPPAILAFGSRNPDMFNDKQATDQILFLARVIERAFRTWLKPPLD